MRRETTDFRTKSTSDEAEAVIAEAIREHHGAAKLRPGATPEGYAREALRNLHLEGFRIVRNPEAGRVVVLDEAGERKLQDLLSGKSVPTGRIVEVTYRNPDGTTRTQRHAEFGSLDKVSYEPAPVVGYEIAGATVLKATETVKLEPGGVETETEKAARWASVLIAQILGDGSKRQSEAGIDVAAQEALTRLQSSPRTDTDILGVFYGDGMMTFGGDAEAWKTFRDMAARVVGAPASEG